LAPNFGGLGKLALPIKIDCSRGARYLRGERLAVNHRERYK
jgi:hypothetical protein